MVLYRGPRGRTVLPWLTVRMMQTARSDNSSASVRDQMESTKTIGDELYALPPAGFTAARYDRVQRAKLAGDRATADQVAALKRPTVPAWLVNLLVLPFGTALSIYALWVLLTHDGRRLFEPTAAAHTH